MDLPLQQEISDCGQVCICASLSLLGSKTSLKSIKEMTGDSIRGLTLRQVRDCFRRFGLTSEVVIFNKSNIPAPSIVLLRRGHYVLVAKKHGERLKVYFPDIGWDWINEKKLSRDLSDLAVMFTGTPNAPPIVEVDSRKIPIGRLVLRAIRSPLGRTALGLTAITQCLALLVPVFSKYGVDSVSDQITGTAAFIVLGFACATAFQGVLKVALRLSTGFMKSGVIIDLSASIRKALEAKQQEWFNSREMATHQRQAQMAASLADYYASLPLELVQASILLVVGSCALTWISPWLLLPGLVSLSFRSIVELMFTGTRRRAIYRSATASARLHAFQYETIPLIPKIAFLGGMVGLGRLTRRLQLSNARAGAAMIRSTAAQESVFGVLASLEAFIFTLLAASFMADKGLGLGTFVAASLYKDCVVEAMGMYIGAYQRWLLLKPAYRDVAELFANTSSSPYSELGACASGEVMLSGIEFCYDSASAVFEKIDLAVTTGELVMLRGPSGVGKSTLLKIAAGLLTPTKGVAQIDGRNATSMAKSVAFVGQDDRLLTASLRENVRMFRSGMSDETIIDALTTCELLEFVKSLPMKLNTVIGDSVVGLSAGQRQRILIARALVMNPQIIILDEATNNLDADTERRILKKLKQSGKTVIYACHKSGSEDLANRIYEMHARGIVRIIHHNVREIISDEL